MNEAISHRMKQNNRSVNRNSKYTKGGDHFSANSSRKYPSDAVEAIPLQVQVHNNFDRAFKAFRALVQKERILSLFKEKQSFEKRSDKLRRKRNEMRRKLFELEMKRERYLSGDTDKDKEKKKERHQVEPDDVAG